MPTALSPRRWSRLMPIVFITYSLAYLDRANYGFAAADTMATDLHISKADNALLGALFFFGYFIFQIPGAAYAERRSAKRLIFWGLIAWGALAACTGLITDVRLLYPARIALGVVESVVLPGMLVFLSHWFTKAERSRANTVLILGNPVTVMWMSVVSGYLIHSLSWRWMFIIEGAPAILWAFVWWRMVDDTPTQATWLSAPERTRIEERLAAEQADLPAVAGYWAALRKPAVVLLALQYGFWSVGVYGFVLWLPSILNVAGDRAITEIGWLSAGPYLAASIAMIVCGQLADRLNIRKHIVWPCLLLGAAAFLGSFLLGPGHFWTAYALLIVAGAAMYAPYGPFFAIVPALLPRNVAGSAMALINSVGALGSFIGTFVVGWLNETTGSDAASFIVMGAALVVAVALTLLVRGTAEARVNETGTAALSHA